MASCIIQYRLGPEPFGETGSVWRLIHTPHHYLKEGVGVLLKENSKIILLPANLCVRLLSNYLLAI